MTTILLVSDHDLSDYINELHFTSEQAAHFYMTAEMPEQAYCFASDTQTIFDRF